MDETPTPVIETPVALLPDLSVLGIQEVDRGICEDTYENRRALHDARMKWREVYNSDGKGTNLLLAISPEMRDQEAAQNKAPILTDPSNVNSDYITGYELLMERASDTLVPAWVIAATRMWNDVERKREETGKRVRPSIDSAPARCISRRTDGSRCLNWHNGYASSGARCKYHMDRKDHDDVVNHTERARNRVISAAVAAANKLEQLLDATSEPVALKAATELLDRAGVRAGFEIDQNVKHEVIDAGQLLAQRLKRLEPSRPDETETDNGETVVAEVIEDDQQRPS